MGMFDKKASAPKRAQGPQVGNSVFWRGMRMTVILGVLPEKDVARKITRYTNGYFTCITATKDFVYYPNVDVWGVKGCEGQMPKIVRGVITDPPLPICDCGNVTWRQPLNKGESPLCTDCRLVLKASQESNLEGNN